MAGLGSKTFAAGDVLTASDVNGYLMQQAVAVFATSGARTTAIPSPSAGMISFITGTNTLEVYDGTAWISVSGSGAWTSYTPVLTPATNSFGALTYSTQLGSYRVNGKTCHFRANIQISTITVGTASGQLRISLPLQANGSAGQIVAGKYVDAGAATTYRVVWTIAVGATLMTSGQYSDATATQLGVTLPTAMSSGDQFIITGTYEIA